VLAFFQFRDRVRASHESFQSALRTLESHYSGRLERTEEQRIQIRKYHTPRLARLALESTSMCDMIRHGKDNIFHFFYIYNLFLHVNTGLL